MRENSGSVSKFYNDIYAKSSLKDDEKRGVDRLDFCLSDQISNNRILDIGCGPGVQLSKLATKNEVHGVDISADALWIAKQNNLITHQINLNEESLPFIDHYFDIVVCTDLLEHLFNPESILLEIRRVLKVQGYAIIAVPNHFYWHMRLRILLGKNLILPVHIHEGVSEEWNYFHIRFFTTRGFETLLIKSGFCIQHRYYDQFYFPRPRFIPPKIYSSIVNRYPDLFTLSFVVKTGINL